MSRSDEPLRLKSPDWKTHLKRFDFQFKAWGVATGVISAAGWCGLVALILRMEPDWHVWAIVSGVTVVSSIFALVFNRLARWGRV